MNRKISIELLQVHKYCKVNFIMFLDYLDNKDGQQKFQFQPILSNFLYNGMEYFKVTPRSFIQFDITSKEDKGVYNKNNYFTLSKHELFYFTEMLRRLITVFSDESIKLFYINEYNELELNIEVAKEYTRTVNVCGNKTVKFIPSIVMDGLQRYEGVSLLVNNSDSFTYLTISELISLHQELSKINLTQMAIEAMILYHTIDNSKMVKKIERDKKEPIEESKEVIKDDNKNFIKLEKNKELPDEL